MNCCHFGTESFRWRAARKIGSVADQNCCAARFVCSYSSISSEGAVLGALEGPWDKVAEGKFDGLADVFSVGSIVGKNDLSPSGESKGIVEGFVDGTDVTDGTSEGVTVGLDRVGLIESDGADVGPVEGGTDIAPAGCVDGTDVRDGTSEGTCGRGPASHESEVATVDPSTADEPSVANAGFR
jgi:hypothetical protein